MIPIAQPCLGDEELSNIISAVKSGWISSKGEYIVEFEDNFGKYCSRKFGVSTSNGTVSLHLALKALGISKGDEVIVPSLTFVAVANAVSYCNAKPIFVDAHPDYWCMDPDKIEEKISINTKAIIPVHLYGHPCDMDPLLDIAEDNRLYVVEDAAEAHGAKYGDKMIGSFGDISCFSFFGNKIITTGEGGICLTDDERLASKMRILRDHGMNPNKKYWHDEIGFNYRMTNMQAAIGVAQLKKLESFVKLKRKIADNYAKHLRYLSEENLIALHPEMPWAKCTYWMYSILIESGFNKERIMEELQKKQIETRPFFYPVTSFPFHRSNQDYNVSQELSKKGINLPSSLNLDENTIISICNELSKLFEPNNTKS